MILILFFIILYKFIYTIIFLYCLIEDNILFITTNNYFMDMNSTIFNNN
jgi:hypothetical protein